MTEHADIRTGSCLCGAVTVSARVQGPGLSACHCNECQRWTGSGPLISVRVQDAQIEGGEHLTIYKSSEWGERAFCRRCGSNVWWRMQGHDLSYLPAGLFSDKSGWTITEEIFTETRPDWIAAVPGAEQRSEAEMQVALKTFLEGEAQ